MIISEIQVSYYPTIKGKTKVSSSQDAFGILKFNWNVDIIQLQEEFKVLLLNRNNVVLGIYSLSTGTMSSTLVDSKLLFGVALKAGAHSIILAHNHPSGSCKPSSSDISITKKIKKGCELLDIKLLDHIILTSNSYYSFSDEALL